MLHDMEDMIQNESEDANNNNKEPSIYYCGADTSIGQIQPDVTHVIVNSLVKEIERCAFENCSDLKRVDFLNEGVSSLATVGHRSFQNCSSLVELDLPDGLDTIAGCAFMNCHALEKVRAPKTLGRVGEAAFQGCSSLKSIQHLDGLRFIGFKAFAYCESLTDIHLPEGLKYMGQSAFINCRSLRKVSIPSTLELLWNRTFNMCISLTEVKLHEGLKTIFRSAFDGCIELKAIDIPFTVETIEEEAFASCTSLRSVTLREGVTTIGKRAFAHCEALPCVSVPGSVYSIGNAAFQGCLALVDVDLREGLVGIGISAFSGCQSICGISLPQSLNVLRGTAFRDCSSLLGVEIPKGSDLTIYRDESAFRKSPCFYGCTELVTVSIPSSMEQTADYAFSKCPKLHHGGGGDDDIDEYEYQPHKLRDRFDTLPVHQCCYHASETSLDELVEVINDSSSSSNDDNLVDAYGMTPLHIVATSARLRGDMLRILLDRYSSEVVFRPDGFRRTMMDYLMMQRSVKAIALIQTTLKCVLPRAMHGCSLDTWRNHLLDYVDSTPWEGDNNNNNERWLCYQAIMKNFAQFMKMETTSILELALWKMKIIALHLESSDFGEVARTSCRWKCGSDVVMGNVMEYAWDDQSELLLVSKMLPLCSRFDESVE
ncbi:unnamed protein product [Cylindrotheca closterium]|uniref:Uncharacterized protein n=1 Tax=Cylindrotheca closterium TaxID=2856 RepID=A0AAD2CR13_9STRA|nr:unnamed protein product [Cylindrotheca closterium]